MKIKVKKIDLQEALKRVSGVASNNKVQNVLNNVLIECSENSIKILGGNGNISILTECPCKIIESGSITLPCQKLLSIIETLKDDVSIDNNIISEGKVKIELDFIDGNAYPKFNTIKSVCNFSIDGDILRKGISKTIDNIDNVNSNSNIAGISLQINDNIIEFYGTNGNSLSFYKSEVEADNVKIILPAFLAKEILKSVNGFTEVSINNSTIEIKTDNIIIQSSLNDNIFPEIKPLIPTNHEKILKLNKQILIDSVNRCAILADISAKIKGDIELNFTKNNLNIKYQDKLNEDIEIEYSCENLNIKFNFELLGKGIKNIEHKELNLKMKGSLNPVLIEEHDFMFMIMPVMRR